MGTSNACACRDARSSRRQTQTCSLLQVYHRPSSSNSCVPAASTIAYLSDRLTYEGADPLVLAEDESAVREGASTAKLHRVAYFCVPNGTSASNTNVVMRDGGSKLPV